MSDRYKLNTLAIYKGIRKPVAPPTVRQQPDKGRGHKWTKADRSGWKQGR